MPWKTLCGFPPTKEKVVLRIPNGSWRPDTVITDKDGNEYFVMLDQTNSMRTYEAIFGDLQGRKLVCIRRHVTRAVWKDGYYFCTYKPNYPGQRPLTDKDIDNKKLFPFSYLQIQPMKGRFLYRYYDNKENLDPPRMLAQNPWLGFMMICCTPLVRFGNWTGDFMKDARRRTAVYVDQWTNTVEVAPGQDLLAALCMAYVFDRVQCQPLITLMGDQDEEYSGEAMHNSDDVESFNSDDLVFDDPKRKKNKQQQQSDAVPLTTQSSTPAATTTTTTERYEDDSSRGGRPELV